MESGAKDEIFFLSSPKLFLGRFMSVKVFADILHGFMQNICKTFNGKHISHLIDFESMAIIPSNQVKHFTVWLS